MKNLLSFSASKKNRQRGAIFFLVLALLSLVVMVAMTMMFVSRLETLASNNAGRSVQARMAAASGVAAAARLLPSQTTEVAALTQPWARGWNDALLQPNSPQTAQATEDKETSSGVESLANLMALDESSRININAVDLFQSPKEKSASLFSSAISPEVFQRFMANRLRAAGLNPQEGPGVANQILKMRQGADGKPDRDTVAANTVSEEENPEETPAPLADLRRQSSAKDDQPIRSIDDLRRLPGMTETVFKAVAPFLTTYSSSRELWYDKEDTPFVRASLNTSSVEEIHAVLAHMYPGANEYLLKQFAVNIIDRRDTDTIPTAFPSSLGAYPTLGAEITPVISEVCPDVATLEEDGDNGEYIEIHNPLDKTISLTGWRIDWGNGEYVLNEVVPAGGFLILTDDIKNDHDESPEDDAAGTGSFFDVFKMLPLGFQNQATEILNMDIPNESGLIRLFDNRGNQIDYLVYQGGGFNGTNRGFQKRSPFSRTGMAAIATPFKGDIEKPGTDYAEACRKILYARMNKPYASPAEIFTIPTEYTMITRSSQTRPWTFPSIADSHDQMPDARLLDCFTIDEIPGGNRMENGELKPWDPENGPRELGGYPVAAEGSEESAPPIPKEARYAYEPVSFGKINVNTASQPVLEILPGMNPGLITQILKIRDEAMQEMVRTRNFNGEFAPFRSLADFAVNDALWQGTEETARLQSLLFLSPQVTFNSCSFRISAINAAEPMKNGRRPSQMAAQSVVHINPKGADIITWNFVIPPESPQAKGKAPADTQLVPPSASGKKSTAGNSAGQKNATKGTLTVKTQ